MSGELRADSIGKRYGPVRVLTAASLVARPGSITALVGRNGAGKTTFLKICAGWIAADHGMITYRGRMYARARLHELARSGLCLLPAEQPLLSPSFRLGGQLEAIAGRRAAPKLQDIIAKFRLDSLLSETPRALSTGERRRASFAVAELIDPQCLLADEPLRDLAPLDAELIGASLRAFRANGCAIVVTGHDTAAMFGLADEIVWMTAGTTHALGAPATARENWQFRREFLGTVASTVWS
ncbi:MAG: ATP-binding cassette domain-containing protein [Gemmatimonadaceae bacterium]